MTDQPRRPRRPRRGSREVRQLMLDAARELFAEHGYRGATTREIAQRADVTEILIYGNFDTKANLFEAAVIAPLETAIDELVRRRTVHEPATWARDCLAGLYDLFRGNYQPLVTLAASAAHDPALTERLRGMLGRLTALVLDSAPEGWVFDARGCLSVEVALGGMLAAVVHGELLFGSGVAPSRDELVALLGEQLRAAVPCARGVRGTRASRYDDTKWAENPWSSSPSKPSEAVAPGTSRASPCCRASGAEYDIADVRSLTGEHHP